MTTLKNYRGSAGWRAVRTSRLAALLVLGAAVLLQACDDGQGPDAVVHVIEVTPPTSVVLVGDTVRLTAAPKGPDGSVRTDLPVQWTSPRPDLIKVSGTGQTGTVVALKAGLAEVSAGTHGKIGLALLEIRNPVPTVIGLSPNATLAGGAGFTMTVTGARFAADAQVVWNGQARATQFVSAQELRAVISAADVASPGTAQVSVLNPLPGGGGAALTFTIAPAGVSWVEVQPGTATIATGQTATFSAKARDVYGNDLGLPLTWSSSNPLVATVTQAGIVTGMAGGVALIRATTEGGSTGVVSVSVTGSPIVAPTIASITPDSVESNPDGLEIVIRGTGFVPTSGAFLNSSGRPTEYISPTELKMHLWPGDLSQSATRQVRVFNPGPYPGGTSGAVDLKIVPGVWSVSFGPGDVQLWPGQEQQLTATAYDEQNRPITGRPVIYRSLDPAVATVDGTGRVRAVGPGATAIEAVIGQRLGFRSVEVYAPLAWDLLYEGNHGGYAELWLLTPGPDAAPRRVLPAGTYASDPAASPDGSRIAFVGLSSDGARNIFVVDRNGSNLRQLTFDGATDDQPAWSRDGARLAFRSMREGVSDIFVINADGSGLSNVTRNVQRGANGPVSAERPSWTPAGRIVFTFGFQLLNPLQYRLVSTEADGSGWKELTAGTFRDHEPEVSPNGNLIALRRAGEWGEFIDIIAADGTQLGWISLPGQGYTPSWAPDGQSLIYSHSSTAGQSTIYMTALNSAQRRVLVPSGGRNPVWIRRN
ncbi:hypothetical protein BH23GEM9_BH23GEM9_07540 [soil metagenome]